MLKKRIVLVNPYPKGSKGINEATIYPPIGLAYLASYLRKEGFSNIKIIDANILRTENNQLLKTFKKSKPDIIGIHLNVILGKAGVKLSKEIKSKLKCKVCIGGPLVSSNPVEMLKLSGADIAVIGEGENTFLQICQGKDLKKIKGIAFRSRKEIIINPPRELIENLDEVPFPAYDLLPPFRMYKSRARKRPVGVILTSRGCQS